MTEIERDRRDPRDTENGETDMDLYTEPTVTITVKEYDQLKESNRVLGLLENAGVDNWDWYDEALRGEMD